jgi:hypothetical protein
VTILKRILLTWNGAVRTGKIWLRIGISNEPKGSIKCLEILE